MGVQRGFIRDLNEGVFRGSLGVYMAWALGAFRGVRVFDRVQDGILGC